MQQTYNSSDTPIPSSVAPFVSKEGPLLKQATPAVQCVPPTHTPPAKPCGSDQMPDITAIPEPQAPIPDTLQLAPLPKVPENIKKPSDLEPRRMSSRTRRAPKQYNAATGIWECNEEQS